jgi:hypothetical protein
MRRSPAEVVCAAAIVAGALVVGLALPAAPSHASINPACDRYAAPPYDDIIYGEDWTIIAENVHAVAAISNCPTGWVQLSGYLQRRRPDGRWATVLEQVNPPRFVSPDERGSRGDVVVLDYPCVSGTYRMKGTGGEGQRPKHWISGSTDITCKNGS